VADMALSCKTVTPETSTPGCICLAYGSQLYGTPTTPDSHAIQKNTSPEVKQYVRCVETCKGCMSDLRVDEIDQGFLTEAIDCQ